MKTRPSRMPAPRTVLDAGYDAGIFQAGVHARSGIEKPGLDHARGALRVAGIVQQEGRGAQREHGIAHGIERGLVG